MRVGLKEIEKAVLFFQSKDQDIKQCEHVQWLWTFLPRTARFLSYFGVEKREWWYQRYVLPVLCSCAETHLRRFSLGQWREKEERGVRTLFLFFSNVVKENSSIFDEEICAFLHEECPSFKKEKERILALVQNEVSPLWYRDETFAQYRFRMNAIVRSLGKEVVGDKKEEKDDVVLSETKEKIREILKQARSCRDALKDFRNALDGMISSFFPIRTEKVELYEALVDMDTKLLDGELEVEELKEWAYDTFSCIETEIEAKNFLVELRRVFVEVKEEFDGFFAQRKDFEREVDDEKKRVQSAVASLSRTIDRVRVLPESSALRERQVQFLSKIRSDVKEFRALLKRGPGPSLSLSQIGEQVFYVTELAQAIYREGEEIENMKNRLDQLEEYVHNGIKKESGKKRSKCLELLDEIGIYKERVKSAPDRGGQIKKIEDKLTAFGIAQEQ